MWSRRGVGTYHAGEGFLALADRLTKFDGNAPGVIYATGRGTDHLQAVFPGYTDYVMRALVEAGFIVLSIDAGGPTTWGNTAARNAITAAKTYLQGTLKAKPGPVAVGGLSMGALDVLSWARANPALVSCAFGLIPAVSIDQHHDTDTPPGTGAQIEASYGGTTNYAAHDPAGAPADFAGIPLALWYASNDASAPTAWTEAFLDAVGDGAEGHSLGAVGHAPTGVDTDDVVAFLTANVA